MTPFDEFRGQLRLVAGGVIVALALAAGLGLWGAL